MVKRHRQALQRVGSLMHVIQQPHPVRVVKRLRIVRRHLLQERINAYIHVPAILGEFAKIIYQQLDSTWLRGEEHWFTE
jgi:hypothetical protein